MKTLAFTMMVLVGASAFGGDVSPCAAGRCPSNGVVRHIVAAPLKVVHAVVPSCNTKCGACVTEVKDCCPSEAVVAPCNKVRRCGVFAKLSSRVKSRCCR